MKLRITIKAVKATMLAAAVIAFAFLFSACEAYWFYPEVELKLVSVRIGDLNITAIPDAIPGEDWDDEEYEVALSELGYVIVKKDEDLEGQIISAESNVPSAIVTWALAKGGSRPTRWSDLRAPATFDKSDFFFFKVYDPDKEETKYYRFYPQDASPVKELAAFAVAGRDPDKVPPKQDSMVTLSSQILNAGLRGQVDITRKEALEGALIAATPQDATARVEYAVAASLARAQAGDFSDFESMDRVVVQDEQGKDIHQEHSFREFADGNVLAVKVIAQNDDTNYYAFQVTAGRMAIISNLKLGTTKGPDIVTGKGTQHAVWGSVTAGSYSSADQPLAGFDIIIELEDNEGTAEWGVILNPAQQPPYGTDPIVHFNDKQVLAIKVGSARANANDVRYYKVQINLLSANFKRHPQSTSYEIKSYSYPVANAPGEDYDGRILTTVQGTRTLDRDIVPLSFELDREGASFTYQWYTANSWYGGYGFDKNGKLIGDPDPDEDDYHPAVAHLDEKNNVSLHNGGNEFYRLPYKGNPIPGANQPTYTPTIDARNRPFLQGFSNQTQYYWVYVYDNSVTPPLVAISDRAAIVTEWGERFDMGKPTGQKVVKKHHIVDTHAYMDADAVGFKDNPRNEVPFKAGNHGDQYYIPLTFPADFNVKDYSVVTCQALFYLADGREWIQNWTQGDFGFADADKEKLVLWYNVTNDNGTRGLDGSGNDPSGSGLSVKPAYLLIQPAGTSPIKEMPPFTSAGIPDRAAIEAAGKTAQGWFTPYIKIVELRFEGPAR